VGTVITIQFQLCILHYLSRILRLVYGDGQGTAAEVLDYKQIKLRLIIKRMKATCAALFSMCNCFLFSFCMLTCPLLCDW